jgi:hypothetical protein
MTMTAIEPFSRSFMLRSKRVRAEAARCRVLLLTAAVTFFCVQLAGGEIIERFRPGIRCQRLHEQLDGLRSQTTTPDLVYLGSSRFYLGLDPNELSCELGRGLGRPDFRVASAAVPAGDFLVMERILDEMDRLDMHPPTLVVEMLPFHLLDRNCWYNIQLYQLLTWKDIPRHLTEEVQSGQFGRLLISRMLPLFIHRDALLKDVLAPTLYASPLENCPVPVLDDAGMARLLDPSRDTPADIERGRKELEAYERNYRRRAIGGTSKATFEKILTRCARHGTRVLLVGPPLSSAHREALAPIEGAFHKYMDQIHGRFDVEFVDCRSVMPDSLFVDHHHLKRLEGTVVFSRYLAREVLGPWLQSRVPANRPVTENGSR